MRLPLRVLAGVLVLAAIAPAAAGAATRDVTTAPVRTVRVGDVDLAYRAVGAGPPLVLIMGLGGTMDAWRPELVQRLARRHRVILFDNRGTGRSTTGIKAITIRTMAGDARGLIHRLGLRRPDVMGWSMGGFIAQELILDHPRDVDDLVLAATSAGGRGATLPAPEVIGLLADLANADEVLGLLFALPADQGHADAYVASIVRWPDFTIALSPAAVAGQQQSSIDWLVGAGAYARLGRLRARTLVGGGTADVVLPAPNQRALARRIRGAELVLYPGTAHGFLAQEPARWAARVERFLAAG